MSGSKKVAKDTYLFREGDAPDAMYILKSGELVVTKTKGNSEVTLADLTPGAMVGEMALFDMKPRSANVKARKESEVIVLPYDSLQKQLADLPVWVKAIMKTMNENMRDANKKIKMLETSNPDEDRYPPHVVNKLLSIINLVGFRYGTKEGDTVSVPPNRLRNYTIQVFQEATNKMQSMQNALKEMDYFEIQDLGEGKQKLVNKQPELLFEFVDWYNDWLFKQEKDRSPALTAEEVKVMDGVLKFAAQATPDAKGMTKLNVTEMQNESMRVLGFLLKPEDVNSLIEKKFIAEKMMDGGATFVSINTKEVETPVKFWKLIWDFKRYLR
ncbi:MAG: cyclic nucleotide-binding domain-containing protein [Bdellovibrionota bacterium]